jgi:hypothetical protein
MNPKLIALQARREILVDAAAAQRQRLVQEIAPLRAPLALADQGLAVLRIVRQHPQWLLGVVAVYAVIRPRGIGIWLQRGWAGWRLAQSLRLR